MTELDEADASLVFALSPAARPNLRGQTGHTQPGDESRLVICRMQPLATIGPTCYFPLDRDRSRAYYVVAEVFTIAAEHRRASSASTLRHQ